MTMDVYQKWSLWARLASVFNWKLRTLDHLNLEKNSFSGIIHKKGFYMAPRAKNSNIREIIVVTCYAPVRPLSPVHELSGTKFLRNLGLVLYQPLLPVPTCSGAPTTVTD
jgi:hypothetical protein